MRLPPQTKIYSSFAKLMRFSLVMLGLAVILVNRHIGDNIFLAQFRNTELLAPIPGNPHFDTMYLPPIRLAWLVNI